MCRKLSLIRYIDPVYRISNIERSTGLEFNSIIYESSYNILDIDSFDILGFYDIITYFR